MTQENFPGGTSRPIDVDTHCLRKYDIVIEINCTRICTCSVDANGWCFNTACDYCIATQKTFAELCCNLYLENMCVAECPEPLMWNNDTFDCVELQEDQAKYTCLYLLPFCQNVLH